MVFTDRFHVDAPHVREDDHSIQADFLYTTTKVSVSVDGATVTPITDCYTFRTSKNVAKVGVMLVGWGGNNGSTFTAANYANTHKITWNTKTGVKTPNYFGSVLLSSTVRIGHNHKGQDVYIPMHSLLPMLDPKDIVVGGWDINRANLAQAMQRAQVLDYDLQRQLIPQLEQLTPLPSIYYPDFIAANQSDRADNLIAGSDKNAHLEHIRKDIREFKRVNAVDRVIVVWTANTERFSELIPGVNDTPENLLSAIRDSHPEISPSTIFAVASILEGAPYINGSPQNTFVPGCVQLAEQEQVFIGGDDFKSGQTKMKSVMVDFLVSAGIKPTSIVSYNHLGNNDGKNLSAPSQFRSKETSKSNVVDDMVRSNQILYKEGEHPDHVVVIKYVPAVADSKRAMDEYTSEIFMGGVNTIVMHNTCEDSLLATPLIFDLVLLCELSCRITFKREDMAHFEHFHPVLSLLSYMLKAPMVPKGAPVVNALFKQRQCIENLMRVCAGLPVENDLRLEHRISSQNSGRHAANGYSAPVYQHSKTLNGHHSH
ncbi:unnamed protein product [Agarophyton chilense]